MRCVCGRAVKTAGTLQLSLCCVHQSLPRNEHCLELPIDNRNGTRNDDAGSRLDSPSAPLPCYMSLSSLNGCLVSNVAVGDPANGACIVSGQRFLKLLFRDPSSMVLDPSVHVIHHLFAQREFITPVSLRAMSANGRYSV